MSFDRTGSLEFLTASRVSAVSELGYSFVPRLALVVPMGLKVVMEQPSDVFTWVQDVVE